MAVAYRSEVFEEAIRRVRVVQQGGLRDGRRTF